jgi:hypothetical protein
LLTTGLVAQTTPWIGQELAFFLEQRSVALTRRPRGISYDNSEFRNIFPDHS